MPDMREGDLGTAACYLTVERLALQAGVESPFWDEASLLMGGCEEPWYKKPLTPRRLRLFLKRYGGSLGMIGYAHVEDDEGTSSPRTPQRHRPHRRFTAAHMTRRLTR